MGALAQLAQFQDAELKKWCVCVSDVPLFFLQSFRNPFGKFFFDHFNICKNMYLKCFNL